jgi:hypothetical protein
MQEVRCHEKVADETAEGRTIEKNYENISVIESMNKE